MTIKEQMSDYIGFDAHMERIKNPISFNEYGFSEKAKILWIVNQMAGTEERPLSPVIELAKYLYPSKWYFSSKEQISTDEWLMELAYDLGRMDGKREERARRHRDPETA